MFSSLADDTAVREVVLGSGGVLAGFGPDAIHLGTSTISLRLTRELAAAHAAAARAFVATPVLGRPDAAGRGELFIIAGGDPAALARAQPALAVLGRGQVRLGDAPQAMLGKILANFMIGGTLELLAEATTLGEKGGVAPAALIAMLTETLFGSPVVKTYGPRLAAGKHRSRIPGAAWPQGCRTGAGSRPRTTRAAARGRGRARSSAQRAGAWSRELRDWLALATAVREAAGLPVGDGGAPPAPHVRLIPPSTEMT